MSRENHPAFVNYPQQATVARPLPKSKIYEHSGANTRMKDLFVKQVEQIVWQYKLAPETINLPAKSGVLEVQVFTIHLKTPKMPQDVLRCIDEAISLPIVFELVFAGRTKVVAAYKRPNASDASRWVLSEYFSTEWLSKNTPRSAMPLALDLAGLYEQLLHRLMPFAPRQNESLIDLVVRVEQATSKQREIEKAASRLAKEKQFNRKVEINATMRQLKNELAQLTQ